MPYSSFNNKVPRSILYPKEPLFHIPPHCFCYTCIDCDVSLGLNKLSARASKCVCMGYSRLQKGIAVTPQSTNNTICLQMSHSLKKLLSSSYIA